MVDTLIRVISLSESSERREVFSVNAAIAKTPWDFFPALTAEFGPLAYDEKNAIRRFGRPLSNAEIGVYSSHFFLLTELIRSGADQMFIFEDDVIVDWAVIDVLAKTNLSKYNIDLISFFSTHPFKGRLVAYEFLSPHSHLLRIEGMFLGTQAYAISRRAALAITQIAGRIDSPIDWVFTRYWDYKIPRYCLFPSPILERHIASTIGEQRATKKFSRNRRDWTIRLVWRFTDRLKRLAFDIGWRMKSITSPVPCGVKIRISDAPDK